MTEGHFGLGPLRLLVLLGEGLSENILVETVERVQVTGAQAVRVLIESLLCSNLIIGNSFAFRSQGAKVSSDMSFDSVMPMLLYG